MMSDFNNIEPKQLRMELQDIEFADFNYMQEIAYGLCDDKYKLQSENEKLKTMLKPREWSMVFGGCLCCETCRGEKPNHNPGCELNALINKK